MPPESPQNAEQGQDTVCWELAAHGCPCLTRPAGGMLWNMMRSWPGSGRPTSTLSTSSLDQGSMSSGPLRRPQTSLLKVCAGARGCVGSVTPHTDTQLPGFYGGGCRLCPRAGHHAGHFLLPTHSLTNRQMPGQGQAPLGTSCGLPESLGVLLTSPHTQPPGLPWGNGGLTLSLCCPTRLYPTRSREPA